jgi:hypothetical protein
MVPAANCVSKPLFCLCLVKSAFGHTHVSELGRSLAGTICLSAITNDYISSQIGIGNKIIMLINLIILVTLIIHINARRTIPP